MIGDILMKLRGTSKRTAADLRKALAEVEAALPAAEAELSAATAERPGLLLTGTDAELLACERRIEAARLTVDRLSAAVDELARRAEVAAKAEADAALTRRIDEAEQAAARAARLIAHQYERLASGLAEVLKTAVAADDLVRAARLEAMKAGRVIDLKMTEERLAPEGRLYTSFVEATSLRPIGAFDGFGYAKTNEPLLGGPREIREPT